MILFVSPYSFFSDQLKLDKVYDAKVKTAATTTDVAIDVGSQPLGAAIKQTLQPRRGFQSDSHIHIPEQIDNTRMYYLNKDHTIIYNMNNSNIYSVSGGKLHYMTKKALNVNQPVLIKSN